MSITDTPWQTAWNWGHLNNWLWYVAENVANKKTTLTDSDTDYPTTKAVNTWLSWKENTIWYTTENVANKVTTFQVTPDDTHYASEKLVKDSLDAKEDSLPATPTNPDISFLNWNKEWATISVWAWWYWAPLYFTTINSDVSWYKKISYTWESSLTELTWVVNNEEKLLRTYLYDYTLDTTVIDAWPWIASFRVKVSNATWITKLKLEPFLYHADTTETTLFSTYSSELNNTDYAVIRNESPQWVFTCLSTDRLWVRVYASTTANTNITVYTTVWDWDASYFTTPLAIRHDLLRNKAWTTSWHTGTALTVAWFLASTGVATEYALWIANWNIALIDDASVADNDYAKFTETWIEWVPYATVLSDIWGTPTSRNLTINWTTYNLSSDRTWTVWDMLLWTAQSVTALKTFDKDMLAMKWTSTGKNTISVANTSSTSYTNTIPAKDWTFAMTSDITIDWSWTTNEITYWVDSNTLWSLAVATYPSLAELKYVKWVTGGIQSQLNAKGAWDMLLGTVQAVTAEKKFTNDKITLLWSSTGKTVFHSLNDSATDYQIDFKKASWTVAFTTDIVSQVEDNITDGHTTTAPSWNAVFDALALKANLTTPTFVTSITTPSVLATANDSWALGASWTAFSDLFLASGAVINFSAWDITLTHSSDTLTLWWGNLALWANNLTMTGSLGATGAWKLTKIWSTDAEFTNLPTINWWTLATALSLGTMAAETATNYMAKSLFDANTILYATSDNTPLALTVWASTIVWRKATWDIVALTGAEALAITWWAATGQTFYIGTTQVAINRSSAALTLAWITLTTPNIWTPSAWTLTNCTWLPIAWLTASTSTALWVWSIELWHASDTTISRVSAWVVAIENVNVMTVWSADTVTWVKTLWTTGAIKLGSAVTDKCEIRLNNSALNDETWSWTVLDCVAGATLAVWDVCYLKTDDWQWYLNDWILDWTDTWFKSKLWICVLAANDNGATKMLLDWLIASAAFPTFTVWAPVYLDDTAWDLVVAQPTTTNFAIRVVWEAVSSTVLHFHPSNDYIVHV